MPRPPDTYTHSQFENADAATQDAVICIHCRSWTGSVKTLNRKKDHLLKCTQYLAWRAAGNGQDIAPPNRYNKRDTGGPEDYGFASPYTATAEPTGSMGRKRQYDITKVLQQWPAPAFYIYEAGLTIPLQSFDEFWDDSETQKVSDSLKQQGINLTRTDENGDTHTLQKCMRVRCLHCGFVRAKNTTRQVEHLAACKEFLGSTEGQEALANGDLVTSGSSQSTANSDIWKGAAPNPNLMINRRGPNKPRGGGHINVTPTRMAPPPPRPSLANHLVNRSADSVAIATNQLFLSHAGYGTLSALALNQWLSQEIHISRALVSFVGSLIGKIRIPEVSHLQQDSTFRALDLLCSAVNNMKKELEFLENTKRKYDLRVPIEDPKPAIKAYIDMLSSSSSPQASILEGLVTLWATEHLFCSSFQYAANFISTVPSASASYSLPAYLTPGQPGAYGYGNNNSHTDGAHVSALHEAFIQNWTSANFVRFVEACKSIVDEVANAQTGANGKTEMANCERVFAQTLWLWGQIWPELDGIDEEEDGSPEAGNELLPQARGGGANGNGTGKPVEIDDDADGEVTSDSPYGGTGLGAIVAHNRDSVSSR